jgi:hypothetical protein
MLKRPPLWTTAVAAVAVGLSACGGGSVSTATTPPAPSTTRASTPTATSPTTATTTKSGARTVAQLKSALLGLKDLPSGFVLQPAGGSGSDGGAASSKDSGCAPWVKLSNAKTAPGSKASSTVAFSGGQDGADIEESIDALGSVGAVKAFQASFKSAVAACRQLTVTVPGQGTAKVKVAEMSAPLYGTDAFAARMTVTGGPMDGLEITQLATGVEDVLVSLTFIAAQPGDLDGATGAAVGKAQEVLRGPTAGA